MPDQEAALLHAFVLDGQGGARSIERAALDELADFGRPSRILLCVLVDRGGRELPIQPDVAGRKISATPNQQVEVRVPEIDGRLGVELLTRGAASA